jgi:hypothetical protein
MKKLRNILTIVIIGFAFPLFGQTNLNDTIFIQKDSVLGTAQSIYFDNNRNSKFYDKINYWNFLQFDNESFKYSTDYLKENKQILIKKKPEIPMTKWVTLKQYKGNFYAYHPCDFYTHFRASINDTTYIDWTGEGPVANRILNQKKINDNTYEFKLTGIYDKDRTLVIHIIDRNNGIAVFEETNSGNDKKYYLMISADKIKSVPLIVNNCETQKQLELQFEEPDYIELLKTK